MKAQRVNSLLSIGFVAALFVGCEITTVPGPAPIVKPANNVVINELYILPPPNAYAHHWIEFYNPTSQGIRLSNWTLGFRTRRVFIATDTTGLIFKAFVQDSVATYYDVPFQSRNTVIIDTNVFRTSTNLTIPAFNFMTIVSDGERMKNFTAWGSEGGIRMDLGGGGFNGQPIIGFESYQFFINDSTQIDSLVQVFYIFSFQPSDQLVLKDSTGTVLDVFRYGNYTVTAPGSDPYPGNRSIGPIVPYQSFARFAGAYTSGSGGNAAQGSSADDFYITGVGVPYTIPIPHWLSQEYKH
jgi:hypothetical protein